MAMKFKIVYNNDIRIFKADTDNLDELLPAIRTFVDQQFGIENFDATYIDEEDEKITITRALDLAEAVQRYKNLNKVPKIHVTIRQKLLPVPSSVMGPGVVVPPTEDTDIQQQLPQQRRYADDNLSVPGSQWMVQPSLSSMQTRNKIFEVIDQLDMSLLPSDKEFINISIGDPTKYPNLSPSTSVIKAVQSKLLSQQSNGYTVSYGLEAARVAISKKFSYPHIKCSEEDVLLTIGASDAINMSLCALLNEGDNFLAPCPGYPFYDTVASRYNFQIKKYNLDADNEWQVDIAHLKSLIDKRTKAILVNNPSNPCGSVLNEQSLMRILKVAEDYSIPIISDDVYSEMVYDSNLANRNKAYSLAALSRKVPILTVNGLSKQYLVPGWRVGWIVIHDPIGAFVKVRTALQKLSTVLLGPNTLIQSSIPSILFETPDKYYDELNEKLSRQSALLYNALNDIEALKPIKGRGAIFLMVKIEVNKLHGIKNDIDFANKLLREQGVLVLPGTIFGIANYFRAVICPPPHIIAEIGKRMKEFCEKYSVNNAKVSKL
eukprot:CAMPEP_0197031618 /NCGR_PEP_ID=MMETSP1384-20130603/10572_1 /TAXON_ID=29189 /ORGANISM="Ammonia sp." /LENGTH=546 /DNA_ID=CAMNT_0042461175 /DNA_START=45 /DNA_END=1685 /DNA_ORIENTATION=+